MYLRLEIQGGSQTLNLSPQVWGSSHLRQKKFQDVHVISAQQRTKQKLSQMKQDAAFINTEKGKQTEDIWLEGGGGGAIS